jgi:hypothetical protein
MRMKNKRGGFEDLFIFMITSFILVVVLGMMIYLATTVTDELKELTGGMEEYTDVEGDNITTVIDYTLGSVVASYQSLYWISILLIFGMIISIFIGSYMVTTRPVFFIPYFIMLIISLIISVVIANVYEEIIATPELAATFVKFWGANYVLLYLPMWITIIGFTGAIIMYSRIGKESAMAYGGYR